MIFRHRNLIVLLTGRDLVAFLKLFAAGERGAPVFGPDRRFAQAVRRLRRRGVRIVTLRGKRRSARHTRYALPPTRTSSAIVRDDD